MSTSGKATLAITGYTDRLSVRPGETLSFMVSSEYPRYDVKIVRLIHGDPNEVGPGFKSEAVEAHVEGTYDGRVQRFHHGSCIVVPSAPALKSVSSFTIQCWVYPTTSEKRERTILAHGSEDKGPWHSLAIGRDGRLTLKLRDAKGASGSVTSEVPLAPFVWYFVAASYNHRTSRAAIVQRAVAPCEKSDRDSEVQQVLRTETVGPIESDLTIAATVSPDGSKRKCFNGKLDGLKLFSRALSKAELESLRGDGSTRPLASSLVAEWDFARNTSSSEIRDLSKNKLHGRALNLPTRAVTGHNWSGLTHDFKRAPKEYNAIHFHDDDQGHAGWSVDFRYTLPKAMRSGVYAAHLRAGPHEDYVPFFVLPPKGRPSAKIAFLVPTFSYMAYSDEETLATSNTAKSLGASVSKYPSQPQDVYIVSNRLTSLYDHHSDDSGVCYVSSLRPLVNMRPKYNMPGLSEGNGAPHQFNADLHLVDWLEAKEFKYDVVTDEDLHHEGLGLIEKYRVIVTGSHPEYWSAQMLDSMQAYLNGGGRLMYLGGNGFYWVTAVNPEDRHVFEVRRWGGTGSWIARPGEYYLSTTGELGGLWRNRARAPNKMLGIGFTAQGFDANRPYHRTPGSFDKGVSFIFEGVGKSQAIGDYQSLVQNEGAGGFEIDRLDHSLGTPPHAILLATAKGFSNSYQHVLEENTMTDSKQGGQDSDLVRADMVYLSYPKGGAVFSVGSIAWCGSLYYNGYENPVSRVTGNVLSKFASTDSLP